MNIKYVLPAILLFCIAPCYLLAQTSSETTQADSLFQHYQEEEALAAYNLVLADHPKNFKALWRSSLLYARIGNRFDDKDKEKQYFNKAKERAQQALDIDPVHTQSNYVMAVAMGRMALIVGAKARVAASRDIKNFADRSIEADSTNAGAWHVLGRWNYEISNLNFAERLAANVLFGGIPEGASTEKAATYLEKSIALNPNFLLSYYDLAKAYEELGKDDQAIASCRQALQKPTHSVDDDMVKKDCRELIDDLN